MIKIEIKENLSQDKDSAYKLKVIKLFGIKLYSFKFESSSTKYIEHFKSTDSESKLGL